MSHRVIGVIFVIVPLISAIMAPKGVKHIFKNLFDRWDSDDKKWMMLFFPYLFMAKWIHMPDQREVKSGQRFADGMLWFAGALMGITGIILLLGTTLFDFGAGVHGVTLFLHDIGFLLIAVFGLAHIFLGAGIFQPYRGTAKLMFGDGTVSESRRPVPLGPLGPQGDRHGRERGGEGEVKARRPVRAAANRGGTGAGWVTRPDAPGLSS